MNVGFARRPVILCFVNHYLPGFRSGGPVRSIANLVEHLGDEFDIRIVTRDRDALDTAPYADVQIDAWNAVGKAQVFYASEKTVTLHGVARLLRETYHEVLYLNSFFSSGFTALPLLARRIGLAPRTPCVIAPRGEFSAGAFALKAWKKRPYVWSAKITGLYRGLCWQASSPLEAQDIQREISVPATEIKVAPNLSPVMSPQAAESGTRDPGPLRLIFLSRISPKKNLDFLLRVLQRVSRPVSLKIIGPIRDLAHWRQCQKIIEAINPPVSVEYLGEVAPDQVSETFSKHDLFVLPTKGENYGHVILESLMAGTSVVASDQTPWRSSGDGAVEVLSLSSMDPWIESIERWAAKRKADLEGNRVLALNHARNYLATGDVVTKNRDLFLGRLLEESKG